MNKEKVFIVVAFFTLIVLGGIVALYSLFSNNPADIEAGAEVEESTFPELAAGSGRVNPETIPALEIPTEEATVETSVPTETPTEETVPTELPIEAEMSAEEAAPTGEDIVEEDSVGTTDYDIYCATEGWIKDHRGFAVERGGKLYFMGTKVPSTVISKYDVGYQVGPGFSEGASASLYLDDQREISDVPTEAKEAWISVGDFPVYYLDSGEELRYYDKEVVDTLEFYPVEFYGYTICATGRQELYYPIENHTYGSLPGNLSNPAVYNMDGTPVEDVRKLEYGKPYTYEWYEGQDYHSQTMIADCRCYLVNRSPIEATVSRTKSGYQIVDLSNLKPGLYTSVNEIFVFEVK